AQVARVRGAAHVLVSDTSPLARSIIAQHKGLVAMDPSGQRATGVLQDLAGRSSFQAIFDSVGTVETMTEALGLLAEAGTYVNLAVHDLTLPLNVERLGSERTVTTSSNAYYRDEREAHALIASGAVDVRTMITHRFPLEDYQQAFDLLLRASREAYKVVFEMAG
ncbi:MAG: zinc-binding dehydrogenase, partial [Chloroflexi bacterium]|nr:zinc-binding dehydrogenase [Chloroflexota bacterium]